MQDSYAVTPGDLEPDVAWPPRPGVAVLGPLVEADVSDAELERRAAAAALLAWSFTGGRGFTDDRRHVHPDVAEVICTSVVRSLRNPALPLAPEAPPFSGLPGSFTDWSFGEAAVLDALRGTVP